MYFRRLDGIFLEVLNQKHALLATIEKCINTNMSDCFLSCDKSKSKWMIKILLIFYYFIIVLHKLIEHQQERSPEIYFKKIMYFC